MATQFVHFFSFYYNISSLQMCNSQYITISILVIVLLVWFIKNKNNEHFSPALDHPTKCVSCEQQFKPQCAWKGQKTKCFSCLKQAYQLSGGNECAVFNEQPIKYYELPPIPGMGYPKMGYM
jgi:hypothetical protein